MIESTQLKAIIEGALFAANTPLTVDKLLSLFDKEDAPTAGEVKEVLAAIQEDYQDQSVQLQDLSSGYAFRVTSEVGEWVNRLWDAKPARYSRAFLETLAIIAYRQPITRGEIESIRGVAVSTHIIKTLMERNWLRVVGHKDVPGKPALLATTKDFLNYFSLKSLQDLPTLTEIHNLELAAEALESNLSEDPQAALALETESESDSEAEPEVDVEEHTEVVIQGATEDDEHEEAEEIQ